MSREINIPHDYIWMVKGSSDPRRLFRRYVEGYVRNSHPGWELDHIEKMKAVIKQKVE